jgi:hypothetical protein
MSVMPSVIIFCPPAFDVSLLASLWGIILFYFIVFYFIGFFLWGWLPNPDLRLTPNCVCGQFINFRWWIQG